MSINGRPLAYSSPPSFEPTTDGPAEAETPESSLPEEGSPAPAATHPGRIRKCRSQYDMPLDKSPVFPEPHLLFGYLPHDLSLMSKWRRTRRRIRLVPPLYFYCSNLQYFIRHVNDFDSLVRILEASEYQLAPHLAPAGGTGRRGGFGNPFSRPTRGAEPSGSGPSGSGVASKGDDRQNQPNQNQFKPKVLPAGAKKTLQDILTCATDTILEPASVQIVNLENCDRAIMRCRIKLDRLRERLDDRSIDVAQRADLGDEISVEMRNLRQARAAGVSVGIQLMHLLFTLNIQLRGQIRIFRDFLNEHGMEARETINARIAGGAHDPGPQTTWGRLRSAARKAKREIGEFLDNGQERRTKLDHELKAPKRFSIRYQLLKLRFPLAFDEPPAPEGVDLNEEAGEQFRRRDGQLYDTEEAKDAFSKLKRKMQASGKWSNTGALLLKQKVQTRIDIYESEIRRRQSEQAPHESRNPSSSVTVGGNMASATSSNNGGISNADTLNGANVSRCSGNDEEGKRGENEGNLTATNSAATKVNGHACNGASMARDLTAIKSNINCGKHV